MTNQEITKLALYYHQACGYCHWVVQQMKAMELEGVEFCDIRKHPEFAKELREQGGKQQVPCLRIGREGQVDEWLYESMDIVEFLKNKFV